MAGPSERRTHEAAEGVAHSRQLAEVAGECGIAGLLRDSSPHLEPLIPGDDRVRWCRVGPSGGRPFEYTLRLDHPAWWNEYEQPAGVRTGTPAEDFEIGRHLPVGQVRAELRLDNSDCVAVCIEHLDVGSGPVVVN
jgi:hypothetical protein